jgi:hypothetical protein
MSGTSSLPPDYLSQCLRAFNEWRDSLDERSDRLEGNLVAIPEIDSRCGAIRVTTTNVVKAEAGPNDQIYLGDKGTMSSLVHGSVVALHSAAHGRFLQMTTHQCASRESQALERLPKSWESEVFLVVALGDLHFAFYSILNHQFLGASHFGDVLGYWPAVDLCTEGISDEAFVDQIPSCSVFEVMSESSDGRILSVFSKRTKKFVEMEPSGKVICKATRVSNLGIVQIAAVMHAEKLGPLNMNWVTNPAAETSIHQSFTRFVKWKEELSSFANRLEGNMMAAAQATSAGNIVDVRTNVVDRASTKNTKIQLGKLAMVRDLTHGNVVAFHSAKHNGFLDMNWNRIERIECGAGMLSLDEARTNFLVIDLGDGRFSFYSISHEKFLVAKSNDAVIGVQLNMYLRESGATDRFIFDHIPDGGVFLVRQEPSDGSALSLYSEKLQTYVTMNDGGTVDATAISPGDSQCFQIVLLFKVDELGT